MVQYHDLRNGDINPMTLITFQDGQVVMRDGQVGTEQACCCGANCGDCPLTCCLIIEGKDTCAGGTELVSLDPLIVINWGGGLVETGHFVGSYTYLSDARDIRVDFSWICEDGVLKMDVEIEEKIPGGNDEPVTSRRRWANARATLGPDGCPTGVELGEPTESDGPDPIMPTFAWSCT